ncbi:MAG: hypothetical protein N2Z20_00970 [Elusimicrobiales bacterium]|nr:hypothetical protein [Elusimicrobiales bacterium]
MVFLLNFLLVILFSQEQENFFTSLEISSYTKETTSLYNQNFDKIIEEIKLELYSITDDKIKKDAEKILQNTLDGLKILKKTPTNICVYNISQSLLNLRKALISFYIKTNKYPFDLNELVPNFLFFIPQINIHGECNSRIKYIRNTNYDKDYTKAIDSSTEYLYFSDPKSSYWGFLIINSTHTFNEIPYYKY